MSADAQRIDLWLWQARFYKTRSLATAVVTKGRVRIARDGTIRRISKASTTVRPGDELTWPRNGKIVALEILALGERRGPAAEAQALYRLIENDETEQARD
ncbi:RNA-binding S4 domain-containing protein [Maricaulis sp.]|uniref:RNA-binding S4 domain-containing protein n=1 Tax=Maricaulis sp. TaxID=1486257 RepID=UPI002625482D|nr:RNA-binding S4 domain-containing protein [Maricaulis sp.]